MSPTDPTPIDPRVDGLAGDIERVSRRVGDLEESTSQRLDRLEGQLKDLAESVACAFNTDQLRMPLSWLMLARSGDVDAALGLLDDLVQWLSDVHLHYPNTALPSCWMWHPHVVEELWWLRSAHIQCYAGRGWAVTAGQWHESMRPGVVQRVASTKACSLDQHVSGPSSLDQPVSDAPLAFTPLAVPLARHIDVVAEAWATAGLPPEPTAEQLNDAQAHDEAQIANAR